MAENVGINRVPTPEEQNDFKPLGFKGSREFFLQELSKIELDFAREHKPFDSQCAKLDFADKLETIEKESERKYGYVRTEDVKSIDFGDLKKYGNLKRFTIEADDIELEMQNVNNTKTSVLVGHTVKYVCERNHGCSVFIPIDVYEERFGKKKNKKD